MVFLYLGRVLIVEKKLNMKQFFQYQIGLTILKIALYVLIVWIKMMNKTTKKPCIHGGVCVGESCGDCPCPNYLPTQPPLLPILRKWLKMLDYHTGKTFRGHSLYIEGKAMSVFNIIKHIEKRGGENERISL